MEIKQFDYTIHDKKYVTVDGEEFSSQREAEQHELYLQYRLIEHFCFAPLKIIAYDWYRAKTKEELEVLKKYLGFYDARDENRYIYGDINIGIWFTCLTEYYDGYIEEANLISLDYLKENFNRFLLEIEQKGQFYE
jgi:hypothetical protein